MVKRLHLTSSNQEEKGGYNSEDRISQLPDEILISILSFLTLTEAATTSVLSSRWRYLFASINCLDFDNPRIKFKVGINLDLLQSARINFAKWVMHVLRLHKCLTLKEFRVCFDFDRIAAPAIDKWVKFALKRRLEKLELDLSEVGMVVRDRTENYAFPNIDILRRLRSTAFVGFESLKYLSFTCVNVTENELEYLLANCPVLERLLVYASNTLVKLKITGTSLKLKCLEILCCHKLEGIEICDTNIHSFHYYGKAMHLLLKNVPHLKEATFSVWYPMSTRDLCDQVSGCLPQLECLTLCLRGHVYRRDLRFFPKLAMLKELVLKVDAHENYNALELTPFLKLCPYLQSFVLKMYWLIKSLDGRNVERAAKYWHKHLKVFKFVGYYGTASDLAFALHLTENAVALEKMVIDPMDPILSDTYAPHQLEDRHKKRIEVARSRAKEQLEGKVPSRVELVIL